MMTNSSEGLSVICISYFSSHLIPSLIENIYGVIKEKKQIVIVNNASTSEKINLGNNCAIIIDPPKNLGYGSGINLGVTHAIYENLLIINPDIEFLDFEWRFPDNNSLFLAGGLQMPNPCGYVFPSLYRDTMGYVIPTLRHQLRKKISCNFRHDTRVDWFSGNLIMTNKKTLKTLNGFDESYFLFYEEVDLFKRASGLGIMVFISPKVKYSPLQLKASSIDVNTAKIIHELNSFVQFHKKYSRYHKTVFYFLKSVFYLYAGLLNIISALIQNTRIQRVKRNYQNRFEQMVRVCQNN